MVFVVIDNNIPANSIIINMKANIYDIILVTVFIYYSSISSAYTTNLCDLCPIPVTG